MEAVDELRRGANLFEDLLFEPGAFHLEALRAAEDLTGAVLFPALEQSHSEMHQVRRGRTEICRARQEIDRALEVAAFEVDPAECGERELLELLRRVAERQLCALERLVQVL